MSATTDANSSDVFSDVMVMSLTVVNHSAKPFDAAHTMDVPCEKRWEHQSASSMMVHPPASGWCLSGWYLPEVCNPLQQNDVTLQAVPGQAGGGSFQNS